MNNNKVFFYNQHLVWYLDLRDKSDKIELVDMNIKIDPGIKHIFIKNIIAGRSDDQITIILGFAEKQN